MAVCVTGLPAWDVRSFCQANDSLRVSLERHRGGRPAAVFTAPPLAAVGLREGGAREQGLRFRANCANTSGWYSSRRVAEKHSGYKVLIEEDTDRILGAHLLGSSSDELINVFALAIRSGITATALKQTLFAYPTRGWDLIYMLS